MEANTCLLYTSFEHIFEMQAGIERMNQQLAERTDYDSEDYQKLIERFTHENEQLCIRDR